MLIMNEEGIQDRKQQRKGKREKKTRKKRGRQSRCEVFEE